MEALGGGVSRFSQLQSPGTTLPTGTCGVVKHRPAGAIIPLARIPLTLRILSTCAREARERTDVSQI